MTDLDETIRAAADRWMQAWVDKDRSTLEDSLAPDFALIISAIPVQRLEREQWLATACTRYTAFEFRYRDVQVADLGGGMAVMSSIADFSAELDGQPRNGPMFIVDIWRRDAGRWRVCARYSSHPEPAGSSAERLAGRG